jgi:hypothetical protein
MVKVGSGSVAGIKSECYFHEQSLDPDKKQRSDPDQAVAPVKKEKTKF